MMDHYFLYLHGYQSSPTTLRALKIQLWLREHFPEARIDAPRLADQSAQAVFEYLSNMLDEVQSKRKVIIGASLGGLIAHLFKQLRHDVTDVILINPALRFDEIIKNMGLISPDEPESEVNLKDIELIRSFIPKEAIIKKIIYYFYSKTMKFVLILGHWIYYRKHIAIFKRVKVIVTVK